eukprot:154959-Pleurochrysis_carterae.AAC.4
MTKKEQQVRGSAHSQISVNVEVDANRHRRYHAWLTGIHQYGAPLQSWHYKSRRVSVVRA